MDLSLRTTLPAGAVFVVFSDGTAPPGIRPPEQYLACKAFTSHEPAEAVGLSFRAPSDEGEIRVYLNSPRLVRPRALFGRLKVNLSPASAPRLQVSETDEHQLKVCLENCEVRPLQVSNAAPATSSPAATVPVTLTLSTPMQAGAVFIEWSGAEDAHAMAGRAFIEHLPAEPIELHIEVPVGPGAFTVSLSSGDARRAHVSAPIRTTLSPGATPRLTAVEPARKPGDEHPPMLQFSLEGAPRSL
ncbi:MAG TPA: hypothetical protein VF395_08070 [Polyangiaceae bacterium]